ncbi:MAG: ABC transporter substrate-binding protein [Caldilineaceae bacterium]|nr:ABC transporter substrate-binding protein [Caldilineaceae bacterium]
MMCALLSILLLFSACAPIQTRANGTPATENTALTPINVCYSSASATQSVVMYAYEKGIFQRYGLAVNLIYIEGGSTATTALMTGSVDICQIAGSAVVNSIVAGSDLKLIGGLFNTYVYSLMVRPEIATTADLQGKALAISDPGGSSDTALRVVLRSFGLAPEEDVALLAVGSQGKRLAAMESGAVVGTLVSVPETAMARAAGFHELVDMAALNVPYLHTALVTGGPFLQENQATVTQFLQATIAAIAQMKQDQAGVAEVIAQYLLMDAEKDAAALAEAHRVLIGTYLPIMPYPTLEGIQLLLDEAAVENPAAAAFKAAELVDTTLLTAIEASGFLAQLEQK